MFTSEFIYKKSDWQNNSQSILVSEMTMQRSIAKWVQHNSIDDRLALHLHFKAL